MYSVRFTESAPALEYKVYPDLARICCSLDNLVLNDERSTSIAKYIWNRELNQGKRESRRFKRKLKSGIFYFRNIIKSNLVKLINHN